MEQEIGIRQDLLPGNPVEIQQRAKLLVPPKLGLRPSSLFLYTLCEFLTKSVLDCSALLEVPPFLTEDGSMSQKTQGEKSNGMIK